MDTIIKDVNDLLTIISKLKVQKPYHINLLEELYVNENAHSRILRKLLLFQDEQGRYELFESLIYFIKNQFHKSAFNNIIVKEPIITHEFRRIDLWIRDIDYAIIFENKIYNAIDQDAQLHRYIEITKSEKYSPDKIFVIYLPSSDDCDPADYSWGEDKEVFSDRYVKLSYKKSIVQWLEKQVIPNIRNKDYALSSACIQYLDYLKNLYNINIDDNIMNNEIKEIIAKDLSLSGKSPSEKKRILESKISDIYSLVSNLQECLDEANQEVFLEDKARLKERFSTEFKSNQYCEREYGGIIITINESEYELFIGIENDRWYCQLEPIDNISPESKAKKIEMLQNHVISTILSTNWGDPWIWEWCNSEQSAWETLKKVFSSISE